MRKLRAIGFLLLSLVCARAQGAPTLETYSSPDGNFRFAYPDNYDLLVGERIAKATQSRRMGIPVCDFSTALACVIYPLERFENTNFEAAGFSVNGIPNVTSQSECLEYADKTAPPATKQLLISSLSINGRIFREVSTVGTIPGHSQSAHLYRSFEKDRCYELRIAISLSQVSPAPPVPGRKPFENSAADNVRGSLNLILSSFRFLP
jgi:hypothetical protein